jgi:hypothetical protein
MLMAATALRRLEPSALFAARGAKRRTRPELGRIQAIRWVHAIVCGEGRGETVAFEVQPGQGSRRCRAISTIWLAVSPRMIEAVSAGNLTQYGWCW